MNSYVSGSAGPEGSTFFSKIKDYSANPAVRHLVGGIATAAFAKFVQKFSTNYPEIISLVKNSLDSVESKLVAFRDQDSGSEDLDLQH
ncbi:MAG: hypothetical protein H0V66_02470 [Bdellovibrionales bacterium]|nr:hypothetical protein [Bdellovibrionales bacterium]